LDGLFLEEGEIPASPTIPSKAKAVAAQKIIHEIGATASVRLGDCTPFEALIQRQAELEKQCRGRGKQQGKQLQQLVKPTHKSTKNFEAMEAPIKRRKVEVYVKLLLIDCFKNKR
jgi:hypothetical protein